MNTYFAFIDESGNYRRERSTEFTKLNPYYVKACFLIKDANWKKLSILRKELCKKYGFNVFNELKWNHLWKLRRRDEKKLPIRLKTNESFLNNITFDVANKYIRDFVSSIPEYNPLIIFSITPNCVFHDRVDEVALERMHYQDIMQRIEMEMTNRGNDDLSLLFSDQLSQRNKEQNVSDKYNAIFHTGDLIEKYEHIMDSISFQYSHQCCGIQMADFIAGFTVGFLRGFEYSSDVFSQNILNRIRTGSEKNILGYGVFDVPKRPKSRDHLAKIFGEILPI